MQQFGVRNYFGRFAIWILLATIISLYVRSTLSAALRERKKPMRTCIRCEQEMIENLDIKVEGAAYGLKVTKPGIFKENLGKVHVAVCPKCGYLEFYLDDVSKLRK